MKVVPFREGLTIHGVDTGDGSVTLCFKPVSRMRAVPNRMERLPITCGWCKLAVIGPRFAFCENVTASSTSAFHIRMLSGRGLQPSGSADTMALCGSHVAWDVPGIVNEATIADDRTCRRCLMLFLESEKLLSSA